MMQESSDIKKNRLYNDLSWTWPIISPPKDYVEEAGFWTGKIREFAAIETATLLDLGCGGGHMDWTLKKEFKVTSVDISSHMLALARKLNPEIDYHEGDMRTVRLGRKFDAVMIHDSINYMLTPGDLRAAFETAHVHLNDRGLMITCVEEWPRHFVQNRIRTQTETSGDIQISFIEHYYDPDPNDTTYEGTFVYLIRKEGKLDFHTDRHILGIFPLDLWRRTLNEVGFAVREPRFTHSDFKEDEDYPMFVGVKK